MANGDIFHSASKEIRQISCNHSLSLDLLSEDVLECVGISSELGDTLAQLLDGHLLLVEVEAEVALAVDVCLLLNIERVSLGSIELLGHAVLGVVQLLEKVGLLQSVQSLGFSIQWQTHSNGQVVAASELGDLANVPEGGTHDDGVVAVLLVVVEDGANRLDTGVLLGGVLLLGCGLVPVEDATDEGRDEVGASLSGGNGLDKREHEGQVGVDAVLGLENLGGLDALPCGSDLDEDALLVDANLFVKLHRLASATSGAWEQVRNVLR